MENQTNYVFFNLLLLGLLVSEFFHKSGRSHRTGLALGLIAVGLLLSLTFPPSKSIIKHDWLRIGAVIVLIISLTCAGELLFGEIQFKVILMCLLILLGLLTTWSKGYWGNLPSTFWLLVSGGAVTTAFGLGAGAVDLGAYLGAWAWVLLAWVSKSSAAKS